MLAEEIGPHEQAEERELYPAMDRRLGAPEATATMSRGHAEIAHQVRRPLIGVPGTADLGPGGTGRKLLAGERLAWCAEVARAS
jgi:hypothetical protein